MPPDRIVILSASLASVLTAKYLSWERIPHVEIEIIHCDAYFEFSPFLCELIVGSISNQTLRIPFNKFLSKVKITVGEINAIDATKRRIDMLESDSGKGRAVTYDRLVIAFDDAPRHAFQDRHFRTVQNINEAENLREHIFACMRHAETAENAALRRQLLTFIVVGGGSTGIELITAIRHLIRSTMRLMKNIQLSDCRFVIVEQKDRLLPKFPLRFSRFANRKLKAAGIDTRVNSKVSTHCFTSLDMVDGTTIQAQTIVITCGENLSSHAPWFAEIAPLGKVDTDEFLRVRRLKNSWTTGYASRISPISNKNRSFKVTPDLPQFAVREARQISRNIAAEFRGWNISPFADTPRFFLIGMGKFQALGSVFGIQISSVPAGLLRIFRLLIRLPGFYRKSKLLVGMLLDGMKNDRSIEDEPDSPRADA